MECAEKKLEHLAAVLSCIYAVFIVTLGVVIYISDLISGESIMAEVFSIYLMTFGLIWLIYVYIDIKKQLTRRDTVTITSAYTCGKESSSAGSSINSREFRERKLQLSINMPWPRIAVCERDLNYNNNGRTQMLGSDSKTSNGYCFSQGRHSGSFYLKVGAAGFCFGHLIHSGLLLGHQVLFFTSDSKELADCAHIPTLILDIIYPTYSFFLLFFIFKYSNLKRETSKLGTYKVIINRCQELARFALMHCIASSLCFWIWTILRETMDSLHHSASSDELKDGNKSVTHGGDDDAAATYDSLSTSEFWRESEEPTITTTPAIESWTSAIPRVLPLTSYHEVGAQDLLKFLNGSSYTSDYCHGSSHLATIFENFSPYLYPFTIEYSILVVGVLFIIWQNIGGCKKYNLPINCCLVHTDITNSRINIESRRCSSVSIGEAYTQGDDTTSNFSRWHSRGFIANQCKRGDCNCGHPVSHCTENVFSSNLVIHADCHSANKGLFAGLIVLVGSVVSIILFFVAMADKEYVQMGLIVNSVTELILLIIMTLASGIAYHQLSRLDVNHHPVSLLDDLLLFLCIPAFFLYAIFSIVPAVEKTSYLSIINTVLQVIQVLLQTPFIIDGLRRCSNSPYLQRLKPGREVLTFLVVCNVAMWFIETFEIKSQAVRDDRNEFYGRVLWTTLSHMTLPLTMFYRFHSSVCLVDIWKSAYEPGGSSSRIAEAWHEHVSTKSALDMSKLTCSC
ncbi:hypothetical protein J437_LFUL015877 [Ladona fulva]|uniref:Otopetrin-2 n=1 Tax=Ladona fulva TaxID=123851 RepID=A0A8K0NS51_LADFU|nr:hypothetical protein J437_LFUL015877 [Ladona fulva]